MRVSVVTPFYNTAPFLAQCVESVLAQTHRNFEYLLVNNRSTDGSREIAQRYVAKDPRLRLIDNEAFVGQVENYNGALERIGADCKYVKIVQADDALFPECLERMVDVAERDPRIGLVSSYWLWGDKLMGEGIPFGTWRVQGTEACRRMLVTKCFLVGSPSTVLYRADVVRARKPFYALGHHHEDTEAAYEILLEHDLGFVHQVLSFLRVDNPSITGSTRSFNPGHLDYLIAVERYGPEVLSGPEYEALSSREWTSYKMFLGSSCLRRRSSAFWDYHRKGLATIGCELRMREVLPYAAAAAARLALNPWSTLQRLASALRGRSPDAVSAGELKLPMP